MIMSGIDWPEVEQLLNSDCCLKLCYLKPYIFQLHPFDTDNYLVLKKHFEFTIPPVIGDLYLTF